MPSCHIRPKEAERERKDGRRADGRVQNDGEGGLRGEPAQGEGQGQAFPASAAFFAAAASYSSKGSSAHKKESSQTTWSGGTRLLLAHDVGVVLHLGAERLAVSVGALALVLLGGLLLRLCGAEGQSRYGRLRGLVTKSR